MKKVAKKSALKYVTETTFEKHMRNVAKSFALVNEELASHGKALGTINKVLETILKEMKALHEDNKQIRNTLSGFVGDVTSHDKKIENLTVRVEHLETKR